MAYKFRYSLEKHSYLLMERGVGFEDIIEVIGSEDGLLNIINHPSPEYPHQELFIVDWRGYTYIIPCIPQGDKTYFMKTIIPSRKYHKLYNPKFYV